MSDANLSEVGTLNKISLGKGGGTQPKVETPREITWVLKPIWTVGETIEATDIKVSAGPENAAQTAPAKVPQTKGGITVEVIAVAAAAGGFALATKKETVTVNKIKPVITWKTPMPVLKGTALGGAQLDETITPARAKRVYNPLAGTAMNTLGAQSLSVSYAGDDGHELADKTVTLTVVADKKALAGATGEIGMVSGSLHKFRAPPDPDGAEVQAALNQWNSSDLNDPLSMKVQGKKIMADIQGMTPKELIKYMDGVITDKSTQYWLNDLNKNNNPKLYPNMIWILPNGLQVRYKPNGDGQNGLTEPMFCVEGRRTDVAGFGEEPKDSAFKLMPNGEPAPIGPSDTVRTTFGIDTDGTDLDAMALQGTIRQTHLFCPKPQDQVVIWVGPGTLDVGTALTDQHLNATALGGVVPSYVEGTAEVKIGDTLAGGDHTLRAVAAESDRFKAGTSAPVVISMKRKAQDLKYTGSTDLASNSTLDETMASFLGKPDISFEWFGTAVVAGEALRQAKGDLIVRAGETETYEAAEISVKVNVTKPKWAITWDDPPDIVVGEKLTNKHLNASAVGDGLFLEYENEDGETIKIGDTLEILDRGDDEDVSDGQEQSLTVTAKTSKVFASNTKTVTIRVTPKKTKKGK